MHLHATAGLLGLAILGSAPAALAVDIPANTKTKATITPGPQRFDGVFERQADSDWYRVTLKAGRNYAFEVSAYCDTRVNLRNATGKMLRSSSLASDESGDAGFEFRSAATKTYFVEYVDPNPAVCLDFAGPYPHSYSGNVAMEVRGDTTTRGTIAAGQTIASLLNFDTDADFFRTQLYAGRSYTASVGGPHGSPPSGTLLRVVDPKGNVLARGEAYHPITGLRVPSSGTYYVVVAGDDYGYGPYSVSLTSP